MSSRFFSRLLAALTASFSFACATCAQQSMGGMAMGDMQTIPRPADLPPAGHMDGIGNSHIAITATPEAQGWFDQGLSLMHDFWDYEAARAFEQGVRADPQCAMCYWGLFKIQGFRGNETRPYGLEALKQATALKKHVSKPEKLYIDAAEAEAQSSGESTNQQAVALYRKLVALHPHDVESRIFLAESLGEGYDDQGNPKGTTQEKISILEAVLRDAPDDSAANHYWIHAMEPGNHPERALESAAKLARLAPNSGHMVHMPGHIYFRCGNYAEAEHWFAASTAVDEHYMQSQHVGPDDDWNYVHNLMYGIANLIEEGKLRDANALSDRLGHARGKLSATLYIWSTRDSLARISNRLPVALRMADWSAVLALLDSADKMPDSSRTVNLRFLAQGLRHYAEGMAALDHGDLTAAQSASDKLDAALWRSHVNMDHHGMTPPDSKPDAMPNPGMSVREAVMPDGLSEPMVKSLAIASLELRAGVLLQQHKPEQAKLLYAAAARQERELGYREPPFLIRPVGETEGAALIAAHDYPAAEVAYKAALDERPLSGFGLFGLARAEQLAGDKAGAQRDFEAFLKAWKAADPSLPQFAVAREALSQPALQAAATSQLGR